MLRTLMILLLIFLFIGGATLAQEMPPVFCGDLAEADCQLLNDSQTAMAALASNSAEFMMTINIDGIPDTPGPMAITFSGLGAYTGGEELRTMSTSIAAAQDDPMAIFNMFPDLLTAFDGDLTLKLGFPAEMMADSGMPESITLELKLVDGVGYINFDPLQPLINDPQYTGWGGLDLAGLLRAVLEEQDEMISGLLAQQGTTAMGMNPEFIAAMSDPAFMASFMTIARTDDGSTDMATFAVTLNLGAMMSSPAYTEMIQQQIQAQMAMQGVELSAEEMQQALAISTQMLEDATFNITQTIGVNDKFVHSTDFSMAFDMSGAMAAAGDTSGAAMNFSVNGSFKLGQFNSVAPISAPANASVMPYEQLLAMMGMMMGMGAPQS